ncbi:MAG: hypothetical protein WBM50_21905 [Acidimicrobiales bacterium]
MTVTEQMTEAQDRVLSTMEAAQGRVIEMNQRMAKALTGAMPKEGRFELPSLPSIPGFDEMPKPEVMIDRYFDFTAKIVEANRSFYKEMIGAWVPAAAEEATKAPKAKKATKSARARKTTKTAK